MSNKKIKTLISNSIWWIVVIVIVLIFIFPIIGTFLTSLKSNIDISSSPPKWVFEPTLDHYRNVIYSAGYNFPKFFLNSMIIAVGTSLLTIIATLPAAYTMIRFGIGKKYLYPFVISLRLIPPILFAIPLFIIYSNTGLIDSIVGLILVHTLISVPLALILFIGFIQDLPPEIEEAGMVDGASTLQIFNILVVPLLLPSIGAVAALSFLWSWNEYLFSYILTFGKATTVTVGASLFITAWGIKWGDISAAIFLSIIPTLIFVFFIQRYLVRGLTFGSVKG